MSTKKKVLIGAAAAFAVFIVLGLIGSTIEDKPKDVAATAAPAPSTTTATSTTGTSAKPAASSPKPSASTTSSTKPSSAVSSAAPAGFPESCSVTPAGEFGLTGVEVTRAAGHPDGAKSVRWTTNSAIPKTGKVSFTLTSGSVMRGVSYLDGRLIANYIFRMKEAKQENITIPPGLVGNELSVFIPAADAKNLGTSWVADLEIDARSTGECKP
ncbi:hypothetical protein [Tsukamurella ocularis]|uniref:hypothetical protein n=1 Tax=Tsukamurella ocularis TaxID=1970234 RepID=UPI0039EEC81B